ncbi:ABC transporter permease [Clostridium botulinum]|uniref:Efflux ABC transporter, permease protein n=1 Tax=Clostridium botulinum (strain Okra / Type B1) TaxID=498213 RepID=B1IKW4_CLOBK|nr:FtsX-like permease family protein [Clostridium botulinum]EKX78840.1 ABC transporter permease [Clostridium botulinum CFSAN001628]ACA44643.1 efflux ABC transporter, permease protein [Clostridium botulinum B1 str. Okra]MBD5564388.1 FtsX-like permease family protein [Clostridium botulinum]MBD5566012.1 FtsX-like permease family protein [Clostridium botulinum]MBD5569472.1 FtsX-like permease family protein [Clostridium botulinum]
MVLSKRIKRVIKSNKGSYIGCTLLVLLSCILFSSFNIAFRNIDKNFKEFVKDYNIDSAKFMVNKPIEDIKNIEDKFNLSLEKRYEMDYNLDDSTLRIFSKTSKINKPYIIQGRNLKNKNEILLDPYFSKEKNINLGDKIKIQGQDFKVVGFFSIPDYIYPLKSETDLIWDAKKFGIASMPEENMKKLKGIRTFYHTVFKENNENDFKKYIEEKYNMVSYTERDNNVRYTLVKTKMDSSILMAITMPMVIILLTSTLLAIVMWRIIKTDLKQIGTLYALGYKKSEILKHYISYPIIIGTIGGVIGTLLGIVLSKPLDTLMRNYFNIPLIKENYSINYIILSPIIPLFFLILASFIVILKVLKMSPVNLMKGFKNKGRINKIEKNLKLYKFKFKNKFKIREITRNIGKTTILLVGITIASMLLLMGFMIKDSMDSLIKAQNNINQYEYNYILKTLQTQKNYAGEKYNVSSFKVQNDEEPIPIYGIDKDSKLISLKDSKREKIQFNKVILTKALAEKLNINKGDRIKIYNIYNDKEFFINIDEIADNYITKSIYIPLDKFNTMMNYEKNSHIGLYSKEKLDIDENLIFKVESKKETEEAFKAMIQPMKYSLTIMAIFAFIIALIVIYVVTSIIVEENKGNISMLKVLGYKKEEINSLILDTGKIPVIIGYLFSIPILKISMGELMKRVEKDTNFSIPMNISLKYTIIGFVIIYLTYEISKILSKRKVLTISMIDLMKIE